MNIRSERAGDAAAIRELTSAAFRGAAHASGTEAAIVEALRDAGVLSLSLVALKGDEIVGHVAFSPVTIPGTDGWYGLGPVSVRPGLQRSGIGGALIAAGLESLNAGGASGCVVLGDPDYYGRFGFAAQPGLTYADVPPIYFQALSFGGPFPSGEVSYHPAFSAA